MFFFLYNISNEKKKKIKHLLVLKFSANNKWEAVGGRPNFHTNNSIFTEKFQLICFKISVE